MGVEFAGFKLPANALAVDVRRVKIYGSSATSWRRGKGLMCGIIALHRGDQSILLLPVLVQFASRDADLSPKSLLGGTIPITITNWRQHVEWAHDLREIMA